MADKIIARWLQSKRRFAYGCDAVKIKNDAGDEFYAWALVGKDAVTGSLFSKKTLLNWPDNDLTKVSTGQFGPPDWSWSDGEKQTEKTKCVCSMASLFTRGCQIDKTGMCSSQGKNSKKV